MNRRSFLLSSTGLALLWSGAAPTSNPMIRLFEGTESGGFFTCRFKVKGSDVWRYFGRNLAPGEPAMVPADAEYVDDPSIEAPRDWARKALASRALLPFDARPNDTVSAPTDRWVSYEVRE